MFTLDSAIIIKSNTTNVCELSFALPVILVRTCWSMRRFLVASDVLNDLAHQLLSAIIRTSEHFGRGSQGDRLRQPEGGGRQERVVTIAGMRTYHQKSGRGIAERLRDPSCRRSSDQASRSFAARLQGGAIRGGVCAFLTTRANIRTLKRRSVEKT